MKTKSLLNKLEKLEKKYNLYEKKINEENEKINIENKKNDKLIDKEVEKIDEVQKKYSLKDRNKICFITVKNLEIRQKLINFINEFELVSQKGIKQKLTVNDCLFQKKYKDEEDSTTGINR